MLPVPNQYFGTWNILKSWHILKPYSDTTSARWAPCCLNTKRNFQHSMFCIIPIISFTAHEVHYNKLGPRKHSVGMWKCKIPYCAVHVESFVKILTVPCVPVHCTCIWTFLKLSMDIVLYKNACWLRHLPLIYVFCQYAGFSLWPSSIIVLVKELNLIQTWHGKNKISLRVSLDLNGRVRNQQSADLV